MKLTAYEFTKRSLLKGWARASEMDARLGLVGAFKRLTTEVLDAAQRGVRLNDEAVAALPFVMAARVAKSLPNPFSWYDFATHPDTSDLAGLENELGGTVYKPDLALDWASASILNLWHFTLHERAGQRVYELSHGLAERLQATEVRGLTTDDLRLPFPNIYIVMPDGLGLKLSNQVSGQHDLGGVYVTETVEHDSGDRMWKLLFWGPPNATAHNDFDDALFHFSVRLPEGVDLEEALDRCEKLMNPSATKHSADYYHAFWRPLFKLVMNTVVYATWPDAELRQTENNRYTKLMEQLKKHPKGSHKRERVAQELKEVPQQRRVLLGPSVRLLESESGVETGSTGSVSVRTLVSGHWQRFAHGPGRTERRWGWRQPFWRGNTSGPESNPRRVLVEAAAE